MFIQVKDFTAKKLIELKKEKARKLAGERGFLNRKQFADAIGVTISGVSDIISSPDFGPIVKRKTSGGKGPVQIPLATAIAYIEKNFNIK
jgi:hypothetical protein